MPNALLIVLVLAAPVQGIEQRLNEGAAFMLTSPLTGSLNHSIVRVTRISLVDIGQTREQTAWPTYSRVFQHAWTHFRLESGVGAPNKRVPDLGNGSRILVLGDPCTSRNSWSTFRDCMEHTWKTNQRIPEILCVMSSHVDAVLILGDNFYDKKGMVSFEAVSRAESMCGGTLPVLLTVPGNHDYWIEGMPLLKVPEDQLGWGFLQFYGQDTMSLRNSVPQSYNFTPGQHGLPDASNFFWYNAIGSIGFIGFSGAHSWEDQAWMFKSACDWFSGIAGRLFAVFLAGHWDKMNMGAKLDTPSAMHQMAESCPIIAAKLHYVCGHVHCNRPMPDGRGFMVGGGGMIHSQCDPQFGFVVIEGEAEHEEVGVNYFELAAEKDVSEQVMACLRDQDAYEKCRDLYSKAWK